jgi:phage gp36-like protein
MADYLDQTVLEHYYGDAKLVQLTNSGSGTSVDTDVLDDLVSITEADIAALVGVFPDPITIAGHGQRAYDAMVGLCCRAFEYHAARRRPHIMTDGVRQDYELVIVAAKEMKKGIRALPGDPPVPRSTSESPTARHDTLANVTSINRPASRRWTRESQG